MVCYYLVKNKHTTFVTCNPISSLDLFTLFSNKIYQSCWSASLLLQAKVGGPSFGQMSHLAHYKSWWSNCEKLAFWLYCAMSRCVAQWPGALRNVKLCMCCTMCRYVGKVPNMHDHVLNQMLNYQCWTTGWILTGTPRRRTRNLYQLKKGPPSGGALNMKEKNY